MKKLIYLSLLLVLINGCSESNDTIDEEVVVEPVIETITFTADYTTIKSLQIVTLTIPSTIILSNQIYTAKFDATEITLSRTELNKLVFITPDLPSKTYNFIIEINGKRANLSFSLQAIENVENVTVFIESEMLTPLKEINKIANIELNNPNINVKEKDIIEFGNEFYTKANTAYNGLSVEDKQKLRKFLIANNISIKSIIEEKGSFKSAFDIAEWESKLDTQMQKVITSKMKLVSVVGLLAVLIYYPDVTYTKALSLIVGSAGIYKLHRAIKERDLLLDMSFHPFESFIKTMFDNKTPNSKMSSEVYNFQNNISKNLTIQSSGRRLQKSDASHPNTKIAASTSAINGTDLVWNQFKESIDKLISKIGAFFNITQNKITATTGLPEKSAEETITLDNKYFKIDNVPSAITQQLTIKNESTLQLKFSTQGELPSSFDAKLKYDDGVFKSESNFKVTLLSNISLSSNLDFGENFLKSSTKKSFTILNKLNVPVAITSITLPSGFVSNWSGGNISAAGSKEVEITFNPVVVKDYSGTIVVKNNVDASSATISVTAIAVGGISINGDLDFGNVEIGKSVEKSIIIKNESSTRVDISNVTMPTGFTSNWKELGKTNIETNSSISIDIKFTPTQAKKYEGKLAVLNNVDNVNNEINVKGNGLDSNLLVGTWEAIQLGDLILNVPNIQYEYGCPNLISSVQELKEFKLTFNNDGTCNFRNNMPLDVYHYTDLDQNCNYSSLSIQIVNKNEVQLYNALYTISNNKIIFILNGEISDVEFEFIDNNTLKFFEDDDFETTILKRKL